MIYCVIGTRAQLVKMAPLIKRIEEKNWPLKLIHSGQHTNSMEILSRNFEIHSAWHTLIKSKEVNTLPRMIIWLSRVFFRLIFKPGNLVDSKNKNNIMLVHGDTFSTILGALLGKRYGMKIAHIESGLRSYHIFNPFPEEINRLIVFRLIDIAFCPGEWSCQNLNSYKKIECIDTISNTIVDSLELAINNLNDRPAIQNSTLGYGIVSIHRFENIYSNERLNKIISVVISAAEEYKIYFILHPATERRLSKAGYDKLLMDRGITLQKRMGYFDFIHLASNSEFVITDGGSNQEELSYLGIPTLIMRQYTERKEGLNQNAMISNFEDSSINYFFSNLESFRHSLQSINISPTNIILERLTEFA